MVVSCTYIVFTVLQGAHRTAVSGSEILLLTLIQLLTPFSVGIGILPVEIRTGLSFMVVVRVGRGLICKKPGSGLGRSFNHYLPLTEFHQPLATYHHGS